MAGGCGRVAQPGVWRAIGITAGRIGCPGFYCGRKAWRPCLLGPSSWPRLWQQERPRLAPQCRPPDWLIARCPWDGATAESAAARAGHLADGLSLALPQGHEVIVERGVASIPPPVLRAAGPAQRPRGVYGRHRGPPSQPNTAARSSACGPASAGSIAACHSPCPRPLQAPPWPCTLATACPYSPGCPCAAGRRRHARTVPLPPPWY